MKREKKNNGKHMNEKKNHEFITDNSGSACKIYEEISQVKMFNLN